MAIPKAPDTELAPQWSEIDNWNQWIENKGLKPYSAEIESVARSNQLSFEDAAFRSYYGLPLTGAKGQMSPLGGEGDLGSLNRYNTALQKEAMKPAIQSLEGGIPETQAAYAEKTRQLESQKQPLQARYDALLAELTGREQMETNASNITSAREFGRRGVPLSSTAYDQYVQGQTNPIRQNYSSLRTQANLGLNEDLLALNNQLASVPIEQTGEIRNIRNAIAALQTTGAQDAISSAMNQYQFAQNNLLSKKQMENNMEIAKMNSRTSKYDDILKQAQANYYMTQAGLPIVA